MSLWNITGPIGVVSAVSSACQVQTQLSLSAVQQGPNQRARCPQAGVVQEQVRMGRRLGLLQPFAGNGGSEEMGLGLCKLCSCPSRAPNSWCGLLLVS